MSCTAASLSVCNATAIREQYMMDARDDIDVSDVVLREPRCAFYPMMHLYQRSNSFQSCGISSLPFGNLSIMHYA